MRGTLFWKVYVTFIAALVLATAAMGVLVRVVTDHETGVWRERQAEILTTLLPPHAMREDVVRLARAMRAEMSVYSADGSLQVVVGDHLPMGPAHHAHGRDRRQGRVISETLDDGRVVLARLESRPGLIPGSPLTGIAIIAAVIGLAAYPVLRHATRRLESLQQAVDNWGDGNLVTRVPVDGRDEVARVAASFNRAAGKVEELLGAHRSLLANASHELRSPLARLRMAVEMFDVKPSPTLKKEILRSVGELDQLVEEILLASKLDQVDVPRQREPVDLLALLAEEGARFGIDVTAPHTWIDGDARLLRRLVRNLLANAVNHGAPPVTVSLDGDDTDVRLTVSDCGAGIAEADRDRVFEPFFRPSGHGETTGGWGLGLTLVRQIAVLHGGEVAYEPRPRGGARFIVTLPRSGRPNGSQTPV